MPNLYITKLYYNTGFDAENIPDSPDLLTHYESKTLDSVYLWQSRGLSVINVKASYDDVKNADYCQVGDAYYTVEGITMLNDITASIALARDAITTAGGISKLGIIYGNCRRSHVASDTPFGNTLPEPFTPSNPLVTRHDATVHQPESGYKQIAISTVNLEQTSSLTAWVAKAYEEDAEAGSVVWPKMPSMGYTQGTTLRFPSDPGEAYDYKYLMPGMYAWDLDAETVRTGIEDVRSIGIDSAIVNMYVIPEEDLTVITSGGSEHPNYLPSLTGTQTTIQLTMPYAYAAVANRKAVDLYNTYLIMSTASGNSLEFSAEDLYDGASSSPTLQTKSDPSPAGTVYCQPSSYRGKPTLKLQQAVPSSPWYNASYVYGAPSGSLIAKGQATLARNDLKYESISQTEAARLNYEYNRHQGLVNAIGSAFNATVSASGGLPTLNVAGVNDITDRKGNYKGTTIDMSALSSAASSPMQGYLQGKLRDLAQSVASRNYNRRDSDIVMDAALDVGLQAPTYAFPVSVGNANYFGHSFLVIHTTLSDGDLQRFDRYLTAYGYAQDKPLVASDLDNRVGFNYVQATGCQITVHGAPMELISDIIAQFAAGVRIWHVPVSPTYYTSNPIKEVT